MPLDQTMEEKRRFAAVVVWFLSSAALGRQQEDADTDTGTLHSKTEACVGREEEAEIRLTVQKVRVERDLQVPQVQ